jgi:hypothetical protein
MKNVYIVFNSYFRGAPRGIQGGFLEYTVFLKEGKRPGSGAAKELNGL